MFLRYYYKIQFAFIKSDIMKLLAILLLCLTFAGCERGSAPAYDSRRGEAILDACEAIAQNDDSNAEKAIARLNDYSGADDFAASTAIALQRKMNFAKAEEYLQQSDFKGLREFIAACRASGSAGTELDGFDSIPDALEALSVFKSRMPWEESKVLKDALEDLEPHRELLSKSKAFVAFYAMQLETLERLKASEAKSQAAVFIEALERATVAGDKKGLIETAIEFRRVQPNHPFFAFEKSLADGKLPQIAEGDMRAFAVAAASAFAKLSPILQRDCAAKCASDEHSGICGKLLNTLISESLDMYERFLCTARDESYSISAEIVGRYTRLLGLRKSEESSPCIGLFEIGVVCK